MTLPRNILIDLSQTRHYHIINRCVRRAFLCGIDDYSGQSFEHQRQWIVDEIRALQNTFCIDILSYAIMSNHYHLVVHINTQHVRDLSDLKVIDRWQQRFSLPGIIQQSLTGKPLNKLDTLRVKRMIAKWRQQLTSISKFMQYLNEIIARKANAQDKVSGRFWQGRFKSQALLDEQALLQCMIYVDLNPVRAAMAQTPESSDYTSIKQRIVAFKPGKSSKNDHNPIILTDFSVTANDDILPFRFDDYLELTDWTARAIGNNKTGYTPESMPPILSRLNIDTTQWLSHCGKRSKFYRAIGCLYSIERFIKQQGVHFIFGRKACGELFH